MEDEVIILVDEEITTDKEDDKDPEMPETGKKEGDENSDEAERQRLIRETQNLEKATIEELKEIRKIRQENLKSKRQERKQLRDEHLKKIDEDDEIAQVLGARIEAEVTPIREELDDQKAEIFDELFIDFASEHPMSRELAGKVIETYNKLSTNSGLNPKAVIKDIMKAYAAETADEQQVIARKANTAEDLATRASVAVTKADGSSAGSSSKKIHVDRGVYEILKGSGMSDDDIKKYYKDKQSN